MISLLSRSFFYGLLLFSGMPILMNISDYYNESQQVFWGVKFIVMWGFIGGALCVLSAVSLMLLTALIRALANGTA